MNHGLEFRYFMPHAKTQRREGKERPSHGYPGNPILLPFLCVFAALREALSSFRCTGIYYG